MGVDMCECGYVCMLICVYVDMCECGHVCMWICVSVDMCECGYVRLWICEAIWSVELFKNQRILLHIRNSLAKQKKFSPNFAHSAPTRNSETNV